MLFYPATNIKAETSDGVDSIYLMEYKLGKERRDWDM